MTELDKGFREFNHRCRLFNLNEKVLLAVSGGVDSVTMLNLFLNQQVGIGIAHCNFQLRSPDADEDEIFVRNLASLHQLPYYSRRFDTRAYADKNGLSIQVAARELRYQFFEETRTRYGYNWVAIAHHSDDVIETFFINLLRGTGIQGLTGIHSKKGYVIRPLLFASREMIESFAREINMPYRIDKSNLSLKYTRNQIRQELLPLLISMNPGFRHTMLDVINNLQAVSDVYWDMIRSSMADLVVNRHDHMEISIEKVRNHSHGMVILSEILRKYRFNKNVIQSVVKNLDGEPGKIFHSPTHRILRDRHWLILAEKMAENGEIFYIDNRTEAIEYPIALNISVLNRDSSFIIPKDKEIACLDLDKITFPLILRHWKKGDYFRPLGMEQMKKVSDFFVNEKLSVFEKEKAWLLISDSKIAWITGYRIDDRFKITSSTQKILRILANTGMP